MWKQLFLETITSPAQAAEKLLTLKFRLGEVWAALVLTSVLNAIAFSFTLMVFPPAAEVVVGVISPFMLTFLLIGIMTVGAVSLHIAGRMMSGAAQFADILLVVTWLQVMRLAVQIGGFVVMILSPTLANTAMLLASLYGIWILLNFVNIAQGFNSHGKSVGALLISFVGLTIAISVLFAFVGIGAIE